MTLPAAINQSNLREAKHETKKNVTGFATNTTVIFFIRIGYLVRGILYFLIGWFACGLAFGLDKKSASQTDIIAYIHALPFGTLSVGVFLIGVCSYSLWGLLRSLLIGKNIFERIGYACSAIFYASLIVPTYNILANHKTSSPSKLTIQSISSFIIHLPLGQLVWAVVGISGITAGVVQLLRSINAHKPKDLNYSQEKIKAPKLFIYISRLGVGARAMLYVIIGVFFLIAAVFADPEKSKGTKEVFNALILLPYGFFFVAILGIGFVFFGLYSISMSFWANVPRDY